MGDRGGPGRGIRRVPGPVAEDGFQRVEQTKLSASVGSPSPS